MVLIAYQGLLVDPPHLSSHFLITPPGARRYAEGGSTSAAGGIYPHFPHTFTPGTQVRADTLREAVLPAVELAAAVVAASSQSEAGAAGAGAGPSSSSPGSRAAAGLVAGSGAAVKKTKKKATATVAVPSAGRGPGEDRQGREERDSMNGVATDSSGVIICWERTRCAVDLRVQ